MPACTHIKQLKIFIFEISDAIFAGDRRGFGPVYVFFSLYAYSTDTGVPKIPAKINNNKK